MKILAWGGAALSFFSAAVLTNMMRFHYDAKEAIWRTILAPCEGTVWAKGFSVDNFEKVRTGMTEGEIQTLLGDPLRKSCDLENCFWIYSYGDTGTVDFDQRWLLTSTEGKVTEVRKSFFID